MAFISSKIVLFTGTQRVALGLNIIISLQKNNESENARPSEFIIYVQNISSSCGLIIKKRWFKQIEIRNIDTKKIIKYSGTLLGDF